MPFSVIDDNFYTNYFDLTHLKFKVILQDQPVIKTIDMEYFLYSVDNNEIRLLFYYDFTV